MKKITIVTSTRADYGLFKPLIKRLSEEKGIRLSIVATGMHLSSEFGLTYKEIENDGFFIDKKIDIQVSSDTNIAMAKTMGLAVISFSDYLLENKPDLLIVLGDRYEIMAVAMAASVLNIPIAHIHGGETTQGAVDEAYRHSITKMSQIHLTSTEAYRKRVIQMGEQPQTVYNVGALGVENIMRAPLMSLEELSDSMKFPLTEKEYAVVTFHPVTLEDGTVETQVNELLLALDEYRDMKFIITKSNADAGGRSINKILDEYAQKRDNIYLVTSLGLTRYLTALKYAAFMIGNSSSGILEGPASKLPTINIGDRQKGRIQARSIINCSPSREEIIDAINKALSKEFSSIAACTDNPYGDGNTSKRIVDIINSYLKKEIDIKKQFYDIEFAVD